jgi:hypothetical protein
MMKRKNVIAPAVVACAALVVPPCVRGDGVDAVVTFPPVPAWTGGYFFPVEVRAISN